MASAVLEYEGGRLLTQPTKESGATAEISGEFLGRVTHFWVQSSRVVLSSDFGFTLSLCEQARSFYVFWNGLVAKGHSEDSLLLPIDRKAQGLLKEFLSSRRASRSFKMGGTFPARNRVEIPSVG